MFDLTGFRSFANAVFLTRTRTFHIHNGLSFREIVVESQAQASQNPHSVGLDKLMMLQLEKWKESLYLSSLCLAVQHNRSRLWQMDLPEFFCNVLD